MGIQILIGDVRERLKDLPDESVHCVVTSPPYFGLRDYGHPGQIGLEPSPDEFVTTMVQVFREVRRVLRSDGTFWLNLGDSYGRGARVDNVNDNKRGASANTGHVSLTAANAYGQGARVHLRNKDLIGIPWRVAFALQADGWYLRQDIIWNKPNPMPESVRDRCTKAHEYVFMLSKTDRYFYDAAAVHEPAVSDHPSGNGFKREHRLSMGGRGQDEQWTGVGGTRNRRSVWTIATQPFAEAHFATFPTELPELCIKAGCPEGGTVLDPFGGAGTTGLVADRLKRKAILIEVNPEYAEMARRRIEGDGGMFASVAVCTL